MTVKRSRSQVEADIVALQAELDGADTDDEVWIRDGDREVKVTGRRATSILGRYADLWKEPGDDADDADDGDADDGDDKPKRESLFKGRGGK